MEDEGFAFMKAQGWSSWDREKENQKTSLLEEGSPLQYQPPTERCPVSFLAPASEALCQPEDFLKGDGDLLFFEITASIMAASILRSLEGVPETGTLLIFSFQAKKGWRKV